MNCRSILRCICIAVIVAVAPMCVYGGLPQLSGAPMPGYSRGEVMARLKSSAQDRIEGMWQLMPQGAVVVIERMVGDGASPAAYRMVVVESPNRAVRSGSMIGHIVRGGSADVFEAQIYTQVKDGHYCIPRTFTLSLNDSEGRIEFRKHRTALRVNLWHFVPFLWRYSVRHNPENKSYYPGALRLYPAPAVPDEPVYL